MPLETSDAGGDPAANEGPPYTSRSAMGAAQVTPEALDEASELLKPLLRNPAQAQGTAAKLVAGMETHAGPLPHPHILSGYEELIPGAARTILDMAREEQRHRHNMENRATAYPYFGMGLGALCLLSCIAGAVFLAVRAHGEPVGIALIGAPVLTGVGWFLNARLAPPPGAKGSGNLPVTPRQKNPGL